MTNTYQTQEFQFTEIELKGEKKYFVEGFISTIDADDYNDVVTRRAQESLATQVKNKLITMDIEHEEFIDDSQVLNRPKSAMVPVAKIIESELKPTGVWVKAEINKHSKRFSEVWGSIKDRFLHSFSIAFTTVKAVTKQVKGKTMRFIEDLNLINVTLTGSPVNTSATFAPVMKAVLKNMEETKMSEKEKEAPKVDVEVPKENKTDAVVEKPAEEAKPSEVDELKKQVEEQGKELESMKKELSEAKEATEKVVEEKLETPLSQVKSLTTQLKENTELIKELKAKLNAPVLKSHVEENKPRNLTKMQSPMDMI